MNNMYNLSFILFFLKKDNSYLVAIDSWLFPKDRE